MTVKSMNKVYLHREENRSMFPIKRKRILHNDDDTETDTEIDEGDEIVQRNGEMVSNSTDDDVSKIKK